MKIEAIRHTGTYPDLYLKDRRTLVITLRAAKRDCHLCKIHIFPRTDPEKVCGTEMKCILRDRLFDYFRTEIRFSKVARYQKYYFELSDGTASWYLNSWGVYETEPSDGYFEFLYANRTGIVQVPEWSRGQVFYQIFPERFCNGDPGNDPADCAKWGSDPTRENYMGGDLRGMIKKLDHIMDLGAECIYLNPVFEADFNHKYATTDYFKVDPMFGTNEELRELIAKAHGMGIRVVLDGVFNHTGIHFKPFEDVLEHQERSEYREWFYITEYPVRISHHCYECVGAYKYMPKLNTANPEVRRFILSVMEYWIREYQIDGWRLDVADEVDEGVWTEARMLLKEKYPRILLLGETWGAGLRLMNGAQMDCMMNYIFRDAVRDFIGYEKIDAAELDHRLQSMLANYPEEMNQAMFLPLDSHDTERFSFFCGGNKRKLLLGAALQMCFVGSPSLYYGDEIGLTGDNDPDCRKCMVWESEGQDRELLEWYKKLIALRKKESCIKTGKFTANLCEGRAYGFIRHDGRGEIYVVLNAGEESRKVEVPVFYKKRYVNIIDQQVYAASERPEKGYLNSDIRDYGGILKVNMEPYHVKIFKMQ